MHLHMRLLFYAAPILFELMTSLKPLFHALFFLLSDSLYSSLLYAPLSEAFLYNDSHLLQFD